MYVEVVNGRITREFDNLKGSFKFRDGRSTGNIELFSSDELKKEGILPVVDVKPTINESYQKLEEVGLTINKDDVTRTWRVIDDSLMELKQKRILEVNAMRNRIIDGGIAFKGNNYESDVISRTNLSGVCTSIALGEPLPNNFSWRNTEGVDVVMDADAVKQFGIAMMTHVYLTHISARAHKDKIKSMTSAKEIAEYEITFNIGDSK